MEEGKGRWAGKLILFPLLALTCLFCSIVGSYQGLDIKAGLVSHLDKRVDNIWYGKLAIRCVIAVLLHAPLASANASCAARFRLRRYVEPVYPPRQHSPIHSSPSPPIDKSSKRNLHISYVSNVIALAGTALIIFVPIPA